MILRKVLFTLIDHKFMYEDSSVHQVNGEESNCKKIQFFLNFEVVTICSFQCVLQWCVYIWSFLHKN